MPLDIQTNTPMKHSSRWSCRLNSVSFDFLHSARSLVDCVRCTSSRSSWFYSFNSQLSGPLTMTSTEIIYLASGTRWPSAKKVDAVWFWCDANWCGQMFAQTIFTYVCWPCVSDRVFSIRFKFLSNQQTIILFCFVWFCVAVAFAYRWLYCSAGLLFIAIPF